LWQASLGIFLYRLFIDETGHDNLNSANDPQEQFLCLMGVILDLDTGHRILTQKMDDLKVSTFRTVDVGLHRREIVDKRPPPFDLLNDSQTRAHFDSGLLDIFANCDYTALAVLIDKKEHKERYAVWKSHPYHYCLKAMKLSYWPRKSLESLNEQENHNGLEATGSRSSNSKATEDTSHDESVPRVANRDQA
jgi:hypothetical protein